ncbi:MAG TPA: heme-binding domain-containing protein [Thermoanaerobaculia bacterium]|jgi:hypothetical protein
MKWKKLFLALLFIGVVIQFIRPDMAPVPVDPKHTIQAVLTVPPNIDATIHRACYDCHSNESRWPWYSQISPVSWWLKSHVNDGRKALNFSEFAALPKKKQIKKLGDACDQVKQGDMPLKTYLPMHPAAHLTDADRGALCTWFTSLK